MGNKKQRSYPIREAIINIIIDRSNEAFSDGFHKYEENRLMEALHSIKELIPPDRFVIKNLPFEDDNGRAKYYEDKIDMLNRIIAENKTLFTEDELRKAWNCEPKNNYEWQKFIKSTNKLPKWRTCKNCHCGEFPV